MDGYSFRPGVCFTHGPGNRAVPGLQTKRGVPPYRIWPRCGYASKMVTALMAVRNRSLRAHCSRHSRLLKDAGILCPAL